MKGHAVGNNTNLTNTYHFASAIGRANESASSPLLTACEHGEAVFYFAFIDSIRTCRKNKFEVLHKYTMTDAGAGDITKIHQVKAYRFSWLQLYCTFVENLASSHSGWDCHFMQVRCILNQMAGTYFCNETQCTWSQRVTSSMVTPIIAVACMFVSVFAYVLQTPV